MTGKNSGRCDSENFEKAQANDFKASPTIRLQMQIPEKRRQPPPSGSPMGFGRFFTDHIFHAQFSRAQGWHGATIEPLSSLELDPAALCFHYGQTIFEGLKAYRGKDGRTLIFRLDRSAQRFANSARRLVMEPVPEKFYCRALSALTLLEKDWIPEGKGEALYLRPVMVATDPYIGVKPGTEFLFYVLAGPSGAFYANGFNPVSILVEDDDVRAVRGGLGEAKTGANYAHSLRAQKRAASEGFAQVLWLDAIERHYVEEVGTMNIFFLLGDELCTPPLNGTILPGITRDSILTLARSFGMHVSERPISIDEIVTASQRGQLKEAFGTGTAAIVSPIGRLLYRGQDMVINDGKCGQLTQRFFDELSAIQRGEQDDPFGWITDLTQVNLQDLLRG